MEILFYALLISLPNVVADVGALLLSLKVEQVIRNYYSKHWQRILFAFATYLFLQVIIFAATDMIAWSTYLNSEEMATVHEILVPQVSPFTSALYFGLLFLLGVLLFLRTRSIDISQGLPSETSSGAWVALIIMTALGFGLPAHLLWGSYVAHQHDLKLQADFQAMSDAETMKYEISGSKIACSSDSQSKDGLLGDTNASHSAQALTLYKNDQYSYSFKYPTGWVTDFNSYHDGHDGFRPIVSPPDATNSFDVTNRIIISTAPLSDMRGPFCNSLNSCIGQALQFVTDAQCTSIKIGGVDARLLEYNDRGRHKAELYVIKGQMLYTVSGEFDSDDVWNKYKGVIRTLLQSLSFTT